MATDADAAAAAAAAAAANLRSEEHYLCSICLDVFRDPVSTPCGHNFCKRCITKHWNTNVMFNCPMCKEVFSTRPQLKVNTFISEMVVQFRNESQQVSKVPQEVLCDACTGAKVKALKSCLVCLTSYCESHLEPHLTAPRLKKHQLIEPVGTLEDKMCTTHEKPLELFCKTDQTCICSLCPVLNHKAHEFVPLEEEYEGKKEELKLTEAAIQTMIQERWTKIEDIKRSVKMTQDEATKEKAEGVQVFTALKEYVDRGLNELIREIEEKQQAAEERAEDNVKRLEDEICELKKRGTEVEQLSLSEDHLHLLQNFPSFKDAPSTEDWTEVRVPPPSYEGTVMRAMARLEETLRKQMKALKESGLRHVQGFAVDLTFDPDTANPALILSDDGKQVYCGDIKKKLPDNPERFSPCVYVLGKQSFSSGKFYFEVQVKGKTAWDLGVARESINRKGNITLRPQAGSWTIRLINGIEYIALSSPSVRLSLTSPLEKVGVFVDYEEGLVSFYDVNSAALFYSFTGCSFANKLRPFFSPCNKDGGKNAAPLVICPVNQATDL